MAAAGVMLGVCANATNVFMPSQFGTPVPKAFLPLSQYNANSWPLPNLAAVNSTPSGNETTWVPDSTFGSVVQCSVGLCPAISLTSTCHMQRMLGAALIPQVVMELM